MKTIFKAKLGAIKNWLFKRSQKLIKGLIFIVAVATLLAPVILYQQGVKIESIGLFFTGLAILLAVFTNISKLIDDHVLNSFENATQLLDTIKDILVPVQNDRVQWNYAARAILQYKDLKDQVVTPSKLKHLQVHENKIRYSITEEFDGVGENGLEPAFFYGVTDWHEDATLDDAARRSSANSSVGGWVNPNKNQQQPSLLAIPAEAIVAVYDFLKFDDCESELLDSVEVWNDDHTANFPNFKQGPHKYIIHARETRTLGGRLFRKDKKTGELKEILKD